MPPVTTSSNSPNSSGRCGCHVNCFQPRVLLVAKQREGMKVRYVYDSAKTPREPVAPLGYTPCPQAARTD
jgi:hypothetical protein